MESTMRASAERSRCRRGDGFRDVVVLGNDLVKFAETLAMARRTGRIIWQNFAGTISVDVVGIGLAAFGLFDPLSAVFIHVESELAFILNVARRLPSRAQAVRDEVNILW